MGASDPTLQTTGAPDPAAATVTDDDDAPQRPSKPSTRIDVGARVGRYTIRKLLGRGGMGAVFEADDPELDRKVAIKVLREGGLGTAGTEGLRREAQALARLVHQNVVMVYDVGVADGHVFLVMQLVEGETIDAWIARRRPSQQEVIDKFRHAGEGLVGAHAAGLVHCDFKPANVLVDARGDVRVGDFGIARSMKSDASALANVAALSPIVDMTTIAGTPAYMAPEQFQAVVTPASDQFAFCCALWECLAGERPFVDSKKPVLDVDARGARRQMPRTANVPKHVMRALERGMAKDPADRFPSMRALLDALEPPRRWLHVAVAAGAIGVLAGGAVAYVVFGRSDEGPWNVADLANARALTRFGTSACAYAPTFEPGGRTIVFDRTAGDAVDLYAVPSEGGEPVQLTSAATWEWRARPGRRAGEIMHLVHDQEDATRSTVSFMDLATRQSTAVVRGQVWDAVLAGGAIYYSPEAMAGLRVLRDGVDKQFVQPPEGRTFFLVGASPSGDRLAVSSDDRNGGPSRPCVIDIATKHVTCVPLNSPARPLFSSDGSALYVATYDGIVRYELATGDIRPISPAYAEGGLAIAPDGGALVYSTCTTHGRVVDAASGETLFDGAVTDVAIASNGALAWIQSEQGQSVLFAKHPDGRIVQLTTTAHGNAAGPRFSSDGKRIVFATGMPRPGLYLVELDKPGGLVQLTGDPQAKDAVLTATGTVAFTRADADANEHAFVIAPGASEPKQLVDGMRSVYGVRGRDVLVASVDAMHWIDADSGVERAGPPRPDHMLHARTSPSGNWIVYQAGTSGRELWRVRVDPPGALERVASYPSGEDVSRPTIRDDGHVLVPLGKWHGDLVRIPARPGTRF